MSSLGTIAISLALAFASTGRHAPNLSDVSPELDAVVAVRVRESLFAPVQPLAPGRCVVERRFEPALDEEETNEIGTSAVFHDASFTEAGDALVFQSQHAPYDSVTQPILVFAALRC